MDAGKIKTEEIRARAGVATITQKTESEAEVFGTCREKDRIIHIVEKRKGMDTKI